MTFGVLSATVEGDSLIVTLVDGFRDFSLTLEGDTRTSFALSGQGKFTVTFYCTPHSVPQPSIVGPGGSPSAQ